MASEEKLGGYWAWIRLKVNEESFKKGVAGLKNIQKEIKGFSKFAVKAFSLTSGGLLALTAATTAYEARNVMLASSLRMSSTELVKWKGAASMMGVSVGGLTSSLLDLQRKSDRIKLGEVDVGLAKSLGFLGVGYQGFLQQDTPEKMKTVFDRAMKMSDKGKAGELVRDILGNSGKEMFQYMEMTGQSLDSILAKSRALMFTTDNTRRKAMIFNQEFKATFGSFKEMGSLFFSTFGAGLTPALRNLQSFIIKNKAFIRSGIVKFAKELAKVSIAVFKGVVKLARIGIKLINVFGGVERVIKLVVGGFVAFQAARMVYHISKIIGAVGLLNTMKLGGALLGFAALYLIIQDIATYMIHGSDYDSYTNEFIKWLDEVGKRVHWVKELSDSLKFMFGQNGKLGWDNETSYQQEKNPLKRMFMNPTGAKNKMKRDSLVRENLYALGQLHKMKSLGVWDRQQRNIARNLSVKHTGSGVDKAIQEIEITLRSLDVTDKEIAKVSVNGQEQQNIKVK